MKRYWLLIVSLWFAIGGVSLSARSVTERVEPVSMVTPQATDAYSFSKGDAGMPLATFSDSSHLYRILTTRPGRILTTSYLQRWEAKWHWFVFSQLSYFKKTVFASTERTAHYRFFVSCHRYVVALRHLLCWTHYLLWHGCIGEGFRSLEYLFAFFGIP